MHQGSPHLTVATTPLGELRTRNPSSAYAPGSHISHDRSSSGNSCTQRLDGELSYLAHQLVPFHPTSDLAGFGWTSEPDRARRLRILAAAYDPDLNPALLVDYAAIRLLGIAAHIDDRVRAADPAYTVHGEQSFAAGYRRAAAYILGHRNQLLSHARGDGDGSSGGGAL